MGVSAREAYAIGNHFSSCCFCVRTAPSPNDEASAATKVSASGLYRAITGSELKSLLSVLKARCWCSVQVHWFFELKRLFLDIKVTKYKKYIYKYYTI